MDAINDIEQQQRAQRRRVREDAEAFEALLAHPGWKHYIAILELVAQNYHANLMKPLESSLEVTKTEFAKGVLSGLSLAGALPNMKIKEAQELRKPDDEE